METVIVYADGITDDTKAIQKISNGEAIGVTPDGKPCEVMKISKTLDIKEPKR